MESALISDQRMETAFRVAAGTSLLALGALFILFIYIISLTYAFGQPVVQGIHLGVVLLGKYGTGGSYGLGANQLWIETSLKNSHVWDQRCGSVDRILG